ncbi:esterase family protein [Bacillus cereus]|uniref:alpha/beta hydrolase n=1 Tax=Bacillus sp. UNC322MFChir4.1 TaxID=1449045 RepID=UPI00055701E3|nr:alpha/beta hydrolase-fold protein [Bacillus sp. UNC322MFChir4.1]
MKELTSPIMHDLAKRLNQGNHYALTLFLKSIKKHETPIVETCPIDDEYNLVTYIWLGDEQTENAYVFGSFPGWDIEANEMDKLLHTNIWFKTFRTKETFASTYYFSINDNFEQNWVKRSENYKHDPLNSKIFGHEAEPMSFLELGLSTQSDKTKQQTHIPKGKVETHQFYSSILKNERQIWIYTPHNYSPEQSSYDLLIMFDGKSMLQTLSAAATLDHLIHTKEIPPCILIGIDHVDRFTELTFYKEMNMFLTKELLPWIQERYHVHADPYHTTIGGFSLGGLAAFYAALQYPDIFGNVLSMSGSVHRKKENYNGAHHWIENQFKRSSRLPLQIYMSAGQLENKPLLEANRRLSQVLKEKGYQSTYTEFLGGHDVLWWHKQLADGLVALQQLKIPMK